MSRRQSRKSTKTPPPTSTSTSTSTPSSPKSSQQPTPKELSLIKLTQRPPSHVPHEHDSTHLKFLNRSLKKNDTELAALSLLNLTLGEYRNVILDKFGEDVLLDLGEGIICLEKEDGYTVIVKDRVVVEDEKGDGGENKDKGDTKVKDSKGVKKEMKEEKSTEKEKQNEENNADPPNLEEEDAMDTTDDAGNDTNTTTTEKDDEKDTKDTDKATADTIQSNDTVSPEKLSNEEPTKEPTESNTDTTTTTKPKHNYTLQDQEIFRQFLLRLKLRRKLLNRLSRRLLRLSHGMDGKINKISPPPPPKYGNSRLIKHEAKEIKSMREELNKREVLEEKRRDLRFQADLEWGKMLREQQEVLKEGLKDVDDADDKDSKNVDDKASAEEKTKTEEEDDKKDGAGDSTKEEAKKDTEAPTPDTTTTTTPEDKKEDTAAESNPTQDSSSATTKPTDEATKEEKEDDQSSSTTPEDKMETDVDTKKEEKDDTVDEKESSTPATTTTKEEEEDGETTKKEEKDETDDTKAVTNTTTIPPLPPKREIILDPLLLNQEYQQTLQQLAEYDTEYEKNVNPLDSTQTTTYTLTEEQMQEMDYEAEYFDDQSSDDNVKTGIGASVHHMNSREKAQEWQRWQNDVLGRIADHPTFVDLGMEHEVFDLEGRRKRVKLAQEKEEKEEELKKMKEEGDAQDNDVVEKDDEEEEEEKDKDSDYEEDMKDSTMEDAKEDKTSDDSKDDKDAKQKSTSILPLKRPVISLDPVPSFYEQDYHRTLVVHSDHYSKNKKQETRPVRNSGNAGKPGNLVAEAQSEYDTAWRRSNDVQNHKLRLDNELKNIYYRRNGMMQQYKKDRDVHVAMAKRKWLAQKTDFEKQRKHRKMMEMTSAGQSYGARFHPDALKALSMSDNDLVRRSLYDSVDRVMIRTLPKEYGIGTRHTQVYGARQQHMAGPSPMDKVRKSVSSALAHCVDVVVKRTETGWVSNNAIDQAFDGDQFPPFKAPRINHPDKMVINDRGENFSQLTSRYKAEVVTCSRKLQQCETDRSRLWNKLMKVRMDCGVSGPPPSSQQRSQPQQQQQPSRGHSYHQRR